MSSEVFCKVPMPSSYNEETKTTLNYSRWNCISNPRFTTIDTQCSVFSILFFVSTVTLDSFFFSGNFTSSSGPQHNLNTHKHN